MPRRTAFLTSPTSSIPRRLHRAIAFTGLELIKTHRIRIESADAPVPSHASLFAAAMARWSQAERFSYGRVTRPEQSWLRRAPTRLRGRSADHARRRGVDWDSSLYRNVPVR